MPKCKESEKHKGMMSFYCPGCKETHTIITQKQDYPSPVWEFNGDMDNPTVSPSVKVTYRHPKEYGKGDHAPIGWKGEEVEDVCHSFVCDGKIQFLSDCTHELARKTVDLPDLDNIDWDNVD